MLRIRWVYIPVNDTSIILSSPEGRDIKSLSDRDVKRLFEDLLLHYKKDYIKEEEMLEFFEKRGIEIKDRRDLLLLMYHAERVLKSVVAAKDGRWRPAIFFKHPEDLEEFLEKHKS